jgi:arabinofuranan 3-O-arabinosyltransferase
VIGERARPVLGLALLAYLPALLSAPGRVPGDTKLSLYLDPSRLVADSIWTWDIRQFSGWVPHQNVGYLWPSGPFYWFFDVVLSTPDWVAHRLWIGTLFVLAGTGVLFFARRLGLPATTAVVAAIVYQLSPYVLPYVSRTSALLLPWSLLGWILAVSVMIARHRRARDVAIWALLVASTGGLNATALAMIAPAPLVWIVMESRARSSWRSTLRLVVGLGAVAVLVNAWWIVGLAIQGRFGAAVLSFSETLPSTAATSTSLEVLRGLGYWLFYDRNVAVELTSAAEPYMGVGVVLVAGLTLVAIGLVGLARLPVEIRRPAAIVLVIGTVLAVGAHPFADPSPLWSWAADDPTSAISLALRSSTRAAPLVVLVLALGAGATATCARQWSLARSWGDRRSALAPASIVVLAVLNLPASFTGRLVDPVLERPENVPTAWTEAARFLDARLADGHDGAVLLVPGIESAAYRWGYPVDPILPALTDKRFVSRDWLPLGSAPYMDALYAFDDAFQEGRLDPASIAPMARLLGADTVMVVNSHQYERFGTIRPERAASLMGDDPPGLTRLADFGSPSINLADRFWSADQILATSRALPEISLWSVDDPSPPVRTSSEPTWIRADGTGLVDAASAGLIDGHNVVLDPATFDPATGDPSGEIPIGPIVVTDSSRRRAHHWRSSQEVWGATEPETGVVSFVDVYDQRLPLTSFGPAETIVRAEAIEAVATGYGTELSYWPEYRPAMALDGDPHTAWLVGDERDPRGHVYTITSDAPLDSLVLERATERDRWVTVVEIRADGGTWIRHQLDDTTNIALDRPATRIEIRLAEIAWNDGATASHGDAVGFREVLPIELRRPEVIRIAPLADDITADAFVFTRLVADPVDDWRDDPEHRLVREFTVPGDLDVDVQVTARLSARASTSVVAELFGLGIPTADESVDHLVGHQAWAAWSAHDGDPTTAWWSAVDDERPTLVVPVEGPSDSLVIVQPDSSPRVRRVLVSDGSGVAREVDVALDGRIDFDPIEGDRLEIVVVEAEEIVHLDRRTGRPLRHPIGIAEVTGASIQSLDREWATECRDDLIESDGEPLSIRLRGRIDELLGGAPFDVEVCSDDVLLVDGVHRLETTSGLMTGVDIDRIVFTATDRSIGTTATSVPTEFSRASRTFTVPPCSNACVVEGFDGWSDGWSNDPRPSAVGRNVWIVEPSASPREFGTEWRPQNLVWIGLAVSGVALIAIVVAPGFLERRRRSAPTSSTGQETRGFSMASPARSPRTATMLAVLVVVVVALTVSPAWSLVPIVCFAAARFVRRRSGVDALTLTGRVGLALVLLGLLFVIAQQIRTGAAPGFGWPSMFARAHQPVLAGLVMWGASLALGREPSR